MLHKKYDGALYKYLSDAYEVATKTVNIFGPAQAELRILSRSLPKATDEYIRVRKLIRRNRRVLRTANKQIRRFYKFCEDNGI